MSFGHLHVFFGKMSIQVLCPFFNWIVRFVCLFVFVMLSHLSSLYMLDIKLLLDILFANILSQSVGCFLILLMVFFAMQSFLV